MAEVQRMLAFFDETEERRYPHLPLPPSDNDIHMSLARNNKRCPLNKIIVSEQNRLNFQNIVEMTFSIMRRWDRSPRGHNFGLYCPPGQGKTFIYKKIAETLKIISVFVQSASIDNNYTLFETIRAECERRGYPLIEQRHHNYDYKLPPMFVFFDEAHKLPAAMMKAGLLNAMEPDDGIMQVRLPGKKGQSFRVSCKNVCWCAATTDRGDLFDAFEQRLLNAIHWQPAGKDELPLMIKEGLDQKLEAGEVRLEAPVEACKIMARYQRVPRLAIHRFGTKVVQHKQYSPSETWEESCKFVADMLHIDEGGMSQQQIQILTLLGQNPVAEGRLGDITGRRLKEIQRYELPGLQQYHDGGPFIRVVSGKGACITRAGLLQLESRKIAHKGDKITAEYIEANRG